MYSDKIKLLPWEGSNYLEQNTKILILGLSIYDKKKSKHVVQEYIEGLINDDWNYPFFTKIQNIFSNPNHWDEITPERYALNKKLFWDDVCFYEYIQERMDNPKQKVPAKYWENSKGAFKEILQKLKPDIVIALGYEMYMNLPQEGSEGILIKHGNNIMETWKYNISGNDTYVCQVQHPSSVGFKQDIWIKLFEVFLKKFSKLK